MPNKKYFLTLGGSFLLGLAVIIISIILTFLLLPYITPFFMFLAPYVAGTALVIVIFIAIVIIVYFATMLGVLIQYLFKPVKVNKQAKGYSVSRIREAGLREKGKTRRRKKK
jgi:type III secretory pathway component EscU